jgi:hypothetical protein
LAGPGVGAQSGMQAAGLADRPQQFSDRNPTMPVIRSKSAE